MIDVLVKYLHWHYFEQSKIILLAWKNLLRFNLEYFSIPTLLRTFLWPWRKYEDSFTKGFDLLKVLEVITFNMMSRAIGIMLRSSLIIMGTLMEIFILFGGLLIFIIWLIIPALIVIGLWLGLKLIF
ncbi:hypothetical protein KAR26_03615 [Candidatus Parcubacteria bacterium]|nr:hypothetical protein [Candidatus Parcubacteria bacterium]